MSHKVKWIDAGREPQCAPDPAYPNGKDVVMTYGPSAFARCKVMLSYPARRCGMYEIECTRCGVSAAVTTAGRPDDPRSIEIACRPLSASVTQEQK